MDDLDRQLIALAATPYRYPAVRETHALERFGLTPTRFWARVNRLIDEPEVEREIPGVVRRLRRLRELRRQERAGAR